MSEEIYYQWQNPHLLKTIYPLREMKLRDFLLHYHEIDTWASYREKTIKDIQEEVDTFKTSQTLLVTSLQAEYDRWLTYFQASNIDIPFSFGSGEIDQTIVDQLLIEHNSFDRYFLDYDSSKRQIIYLERYKKRMESKRRAIIGEIDRNRRNINNVPHSWKVDVWKQRIEIFSKTLPIVELELSRISEFVSVFTTIQAQKDKLDRLLNQKKKERIKTTKGSLG